MSSSTASETSTGGLLKRSVVSCFIFKFGDKGRAEVALFQRSDKVRTYQHLLAPISGSIDKTDPSPLSAAWRELGEETKLTSRELELLRHGKPYTFADPDAGREWTVHPFAFRLVSASDAAAIVTDWEHEAWGWYDPLQIIEDGDEGVQGVPRLAESLRRVYFEAELGSEAGAALARGLNRLKTDYQSGARQLAGEALRILRDIVTLLPDGDDDNRNAGPTPLWWSEVRCAAWHLWKNGRESMGAAILAVVLEALQSIGSTVHQPGLQESSPEAGDASEGKQDVRLARWREAAVEALDKLIATRINCGASVAEEFTHFVRTRFGDERLADPQRPISVLTLSDSSTISQSLHYAMLKTGMSLDLRVLESRPLFEGLSLAAAVAERVSESEVQGREQESGPGDEKYDGITSKLGITIFPDAAMAMAAEGVDLVLIGADRISASGAVSNKTGSLPAILSTRHVAGTSAAVVVISDSDKVAPPGDPSEHVVEDNGPRQMFRAWESEHNNSRVRHAAGMMMFKLATSSGPTEGEEGGGKWDDGTRTGRAAALGGIKVAVRNVSFEWVPPALVDVYVSERGVWTVEDIGERSKELVAEVERLFSDL
ncbi:translation initiation factor eIF-2B subunit family protein [Magnaporthiopsis poae ATCC 64411]|uniref:Translation initiation factor eIF-2B subunit family protein n=1 Tax=Magnaporthiopsis poae (strain ATCC 64411 / 73-15) TaxID=644358 RepID=A0A0C4DYH6_MAGP6|nr:translation initiation factor eIF-2B subunit family protein [Magnaporthiopsis poae ATCC 64411]